MKTTSVRGAIQAATSPIAIGRNVSLRSKGIADRSSSYRGAASPLTSGFNVHSRSYRSESIPRSLLRYRTISLISRQSSSSSSGRAEATRLCPSCSSAIPLPASPCPSCSTLVPLPSDLSLHSLLSLSSPVTTSSTSSDLGGTSSMLLDVPAELSTLPSLGYDLNPRSLRQTMLLRQRDLHPDKFAVSGDKAVELAKELSGRVNDAYAVLSDPLRRAEYILSVHGYPTEETDSLADPMLLSDVLEAREELEEATTAEQVDQLRQANHEKVESTIEAILSAFNTSPPNFEEAKSLTIQLRYWRGLEAAAKEWVPGKGAGPSAGAAFTHS